MQSMLLGTLSGRIWEPFPDALICSAHLKTVFRCASSTAHLETVSR